MIKINGYVLIFKDEWNYNENLKYISLPVSFSLAILTVKLSKLVVYCIKWSEEVLKFDAVKMMDEFKLCIMLKLSIMNQI